MKIAHINAGNEFGGGLVHIVSLLEKLKAEQIDLIVFEEGPVAQAAREAGVSVYVFEQKNRFDLSVLYQLRRFILKQDYTILHTHGPRANSLMAFLSPFLTVKWVITVHSHPLLDFKDRGSMGKMFELIHLKTFKRADGIITVSHEISTFLKSQGIPACCIKVIHNGIRFSDSKERSASVSQKRFTLVTVGRLTKIKGYDVLMDALSEFTEQNWQWDICGDGEEMNALKRKGEAYDLMDHLNFKGWLSGAEIREALREADVFILPSLSEGFPMILLEAADEKTPVIATDVGDVREVIRDASMGWLVAPGDADALKDALSEAYDLWKKDQLSIKGHHLRTFASRFSIEKQSQSVLVFYNEIMAEHRK
ncbi:glycosyltransferase family 4 protein [Alkalibacterium putridalgicola]|uniref:Glycosyl transferase n=1 Tax=Alkalibacterium putridalgicola TaxID=426703 RepID=A0A1H7U7U2_9LACT|nr:glycosyltransferase family 4 protein [Alkalibacterium putridalgicola]GEK89622.1 glycosyl transferase [Alkalibacterium putridalgicola]SEL92698.1 hypothetical protein SAMN04488100_11612 [Alkalibacterium putridalgicola]